MNTSIATCKFAIQFISLYVLLSLMAASVPAEESHRGYELYVEYQCYQCHGYEGQGGTPGGPRIASLDYPFGTFAARTRHTNLMPAYSPNVLSDEDLKVIYEYIQSIPEPAAVEDFPILRNVLDEVE